MFLFALMCSHTTQLITTAVIQIWQRHSAWCLTMHLPKDLMVVVIVVDIFLFVLIFNLFVQILNLCRVNLPSFTFAYPLNRRGHWGTTDGFTTSFLHFFSVFHCPLGLGELQAYPFPDVIFAHIFLSALFSSPFHCALQDGFGQTWWKGGMSIPFQFVWVCLCTMVRSSCGPTACWISAQTSSLVTWSLYEMLSIWR